MPLPYENATSGRRAIDEMQKILREFGAAAFGTMENFDAGKVLVQFQYRGREVQIEASFQGYAAAWLRHHPYSTRMRITQAECECCALEKGKVAVWSICRDWIKGQITAIETGILTFEGAFLGSILLPSGETITQHIEQQKLLPSPAPADNIRRLTSR